LAAQGFVIDSNRDTLITNVKQQPSQLTISVLRIEPGAFTGW